MSDEYICCPGPCVNCGETNYPESAAGPTVCPACDCGVSLSARLHSYREEISHQSKVIEKLVEACNNILTCEAVDFHGQCDACEECLRSALASVEELPHD